MKTASTVQLRSDLNGFLNAVEFKGESIVIIRYGRQCAMLTPVPDKQVVTDPAAGLASAASGAPEAPEKSPKKLQKNPRKG